MDPRTVFSKTEKGQQEMATRAHHLPARVRAMLIMIDGKRSVEQLLFGHPAPEDAMEHLRQLVEGGFIEPAAGAAPAAVAPAQATASSAAPSQAPAATEDVGDVRRVMIGMLIDFLGPEADMIALRLEAAKSREALLTEAERLQRMLVDIVGTEGAARFGEAVLPRLR